MLRFAQEWEDMDSGGLFRLGLNPDTEWDTGILDRLLEIGDGTYLCFAGRDWPDDRYDSRILDRLLEIGNGWNLYYAGRGWSDDRYDSRIAQALMDTKDMRYIAGALGYGYFAWKPERIKDIIMAWQGIGEDDA